MHAEPRSEPPQLAGSEVITVGRVWGDRRGLIWKAPPGIGSPAFEAPCKRN